MTNPLISFVLDSVSVANPDGTFSTSFVGATDLQESGNTIIGNNNKAIVLGTYRKV